MKIGDADVIVRDVMDIFQQLANNVAANPGLENYRFVLFVECSIIENSHFSTDITSTNIACSSQGILPFRYCFDIYLGESYYSIFCLSVA